MTVHAPLPAEVFSHVRNAGGNRSANGAASFDISLIDGDGRVCVDIRGFTIKRIEDAAAQDAQPLSAAEERLHHNLEQGIRPADGAEAFLRALALGKPQIVVSSLNLPALVEQTAKSAAMDEPQAGQSFERPELDSDYVAPEGEIEETLAGFWEDLLGVGNVGVEDSFFDLGGHSLIAVRLFAKIKKAYQTEFPISVLFEAPTIRKCAALIEERVGPQDSTASGTPDAPKAPARRFTHLVAMHEGEGGPKTPFFLVAGMFGNVLNLRHLAHLLGSDRPFFGVQARGLYGDADPHTDLVEAARDYLVELRSVQPHGPYLLGGFSGGGITAYEMARQLEAEGEEVALLVMLDTPLPRRRALSRKDRMLIQWAELKSRGPAYIGRWFINRIKWEIAKRRGFDTGADQAEGQFHNAAIEAAFCQAIAKYEVHPWAGPVRLFRPPLRGKWTVSGGQLVSDERAYVLADNDWGGTASDLEVFEVPGDHDSMVLEPNVRVLAGRIRDCIDKAEEQDAEPSTPVHAAE